MFNFLILSISSDLEIREYLCLVAHVFRGDTVQDMMNSSLFINIHTYITYTYIYMFVSIMTKHTICQVAKQDATFQHSKVYRKRSDILQVPLNLNTPETLT